jgi:hypothetical protein
MLFPVIEHLFGHFYVLAEAGILLFGDNSDAHAERPQSVSGGGAQEVFDLIFLVDVNLIRIESLHNHIVSPFAVELEQAVIRVNNQH